MRDDEFEWDDRKAAENYDKHGVTFWLARDAFGDPDWLEDPDPDLHEERFNRLCARWQRGRIRPRGDPS